MLFPAIIKPMSMWFFVSDLHGQLPRYTKLFQAILAERPAAVLLGGDLLPPVSTPHYHLPGGNNICAVIQNGFANLKNQLKNAYPQVFLILGNDDPRSEEVYITEGESQRLWRYMHNRTANCGEFTVFGYACVPPTPFMLKDWERYDVSQYVELGCISPEEGWRSVINPPHESPYITIQSDLERLTLHADLSRSVFLFHAPPYRTTLDRASLDGKSIDGVLLDVHVGSIAIRRFIEARQPWITLHGHVHESARLTGTWRERFERTHSFSAAHDGTELALIRFDPTEPEKASRELI
jgi:Icc-related predicted phosphoesterase